MKFKVSTRVRRNRLRVPPLGAHEWIACYLLFIWIWRITLSGIRPMMMERYAGLSTLPGVGRDVFFHGEFAGAAYCRFARGGTGGETGAAISYLCLGGAAGSHALCMDIATRG